MARRKSARVEVVEATPEHIRKRLELVHGGDPVLASSPLGVTYARRLIMRADYEAGCKYARLYQMGVGRPTQPGVSDLDEIRRSAPQDFENKSATDIRREFKDSKSALLKSGQYVTAVLEAISVFEKWPGYVLHGMTREEMDSGAIRSRELEALQTGLDTLARHFGMVREPLTQAEIEAKYKGR